MKKTFLTRALAICLLSVAASHGATIATQVNFDSGASLKVQNQSGVNLTGGTAADGNGCVIQLGYYSTATTGTSVGNFLGVWTPLTGAGSLNTGGNIAGSSPAETFNKTSVGDVGGADGEFGISVIFDQNTAGTFNSLPTGPNAANTPLSIRFYNNTTIGSSTFYNTVSNDSWLWKLPASPSPLPPTVTISLDHANLKWESINVFAQAPTTAFKTTVPTVVAPEPTSAALMLVGLVSLAARRRRQAK